MMKSLRTQKGVAMVTVLFIAAVLTVAASMAAFVTINEFRASSDDRRASRALAFAEAGIDRFMTAMRNPSSGKGFAAVVMQNGTSTPCSVTIGSETAVYQPLVIQGAFPGQAGEFTAQSRWVDTAGDGVVDVSPADGCPDEVPSPRNTVRMLVTSAGSHPTARRVVQQFVDVGGITLPIGLHAGSVDANGSGTVQTVSLVTRGDLIGREKITFTGDDPFYDKKDFYPELDGTSEGDEPMPAAAHAAGSIFFQKGGADTELHPPSPNCSLSNSNSHWDGSASGVADDDPTWSTVGCPGGLEFPPTANFTESQAENLAPTPELSPDDHAFFKEAAQTTGLYCSFDNAGAATCTKGGAAAAGISEAVIDDGDLDGLPNTYVAYFEFPDGSDPFANINTVKWHETTPECTDDQEALESVVLIVKNGSLSMQRNASMTGAVFVEDGRLDSEGTYEIEGTVVADEIWIRGNASYRLSDCWVRNIPGPFMSLTAEGWSESDR